MTSSALFSDCRRYRYWLSRVWDDSKPVVCFIGLNPSTADEKANDPTVRRCISFAQRWDAGALLMLNIFAWRATKPADLWKAHKRYIDVVGPENLSSKLAGYAKEFRAQTVIAAWGNCPTDRGRIVADLLRREALELHCLRTNRDGSPAHPLYLPYGLQPTPWTVF